MSVGGWDVRADCGDCHGLGFINGAECLSCDGSGWVACEDDGAHRMDDNGETDHPCFTPGPPSQFGRCHGDGWYRCVECVELSPGARRYRLETEAGA